MSEAVDEELNLVYTDIIYLLCDQQLLNSSRLVHERDQACEEVAVSERALQQIVELELLTVHLLVRIDLAQSLPPESFVVGFILIVNIRVVHVAD